MMEKRLTAYVSGTVQKVGYRARVMDFAKMLGLSGTVENLDDCVQVKGTIYMREGIAQGNSRWK